MASEPKPLFGHPRGLYVLFTTELWERFSFYSMRNIMTLYMVGVVLTTLAKTKGEEAAGGFADQVYGAYLGFAYAATVVGGMLADRLLGQRRAIYIGGLLMSLAQFTLTTYAVLVLKGWSPGTLYPLFFIGLATLACGNGFFKPNISTIVGTLYNPGDARRDSAFTIFYMGINIGALAASFSALVAQKWYWFLGFLLAGIGMLVSVAVLAFGTRWIKGRGLPPSGARLTGPGRFGVPNVVPLIIGVVVFIPLAAYLMANPQWVQRLAAVAGLVVLFYLLYEVWRAPREEGHQMLVIIVLCLFSMVFWGLFEIQGSTITRFTQDAVNLQVFGHKLEAAFVAGFVNPFFIIALSIPFSILWVWLDRKKIEPASPMKFALGIAQLALAYCMLWIGATQALRSGQSDLGWLLLAFLFLTTGELCLSPVGLSMVTKLSPPRLVGVFMGTWFLSSAVANVITGGVIGPLQAKFGYAPVFGGTAMCAGAAAALLFILAPFLKRLMHGVK